MSANVIVWLMHFDQNYFRDKYGTAMKKTGQFGVPEDVLIFPGHLSENRDFLGKDVF